MNDDALVNQILLPEPQTLSRKTKKDLFCNLFALSRNNIEFVIFWLVLSLLLVPVPVLVPVSQSSHPSITLRRNKGEVTQSSRKWPRYICKSE